MSVPRIDCSDFDLITVDGDGTLWDFASTMRRGLERVADMLSGAGVQGVGADQLVWIRDEVAARPAFASASMEHIRRVSFEEAAAGVGLTDDHLIDAIYDTYMSYRFTHLEHYADSNPFLTSAVAAEVPVVLVTNGNTSAGRAGLSDVISASYVAFDIKLKKPDPAMYAFVVAEQKVRPERVLHLGDDPAEDVEAAALAGLATGWINRSGVAWPEGLRGRPDVELPTLPIVERVAGHRGLPSRG